MRRVNSTRKQWTYQRSFHGPFPWDHGGFIRQQPCAGCGRHGASQAAHAVSRKMGAWDGDWSVLVPLCPECHLAYDTTYANSPEKFRIATGVDLLAYAESYARYSLDRAVERHPYRSWEFGEAWADSWIGRKASRDGAA